MPGGKLLLVKPSKKAPTKISITPYKKSHKSLTKNQKQAVQSIINRKSETKYHAEQLLYKNSLDWGIHTPWTPSSVGDTLPLVPRIQQGDGNFERVGSRIRPTKCKVDVNIAIAESVMGTTGINLATEDIYVVMYLLRTKTAKNYQQFANMTTSGSVGGAYTDELLDNGDGTSKPFGNGIIIGGTSFVMTNAGDLQLPVNKEYFTLIKKKVVRLTKNAGMTNGDGSNYPNVFKNGTSFRGSFTYKLPQLRYDDDSKTAGITGGYPTNSNVVLCIGACLANGMDSLLYNAEGPAAVLPNPISCSVRTHYWYKDE